LQQSEFDRLKLDLKKAAAAVSINVVGEDLVKNEAQANLAISLLKVFGSRSEGFLYIEPSTARSTTKPADVVLCTQTTGLVVFECKGWSPSFVERVQAGMVFRRTKGIVRGENPVDQVRSTMFDIKNSVERRSKGSIPLFLYFVALPNFPRSEWIAKGFSEDFPASELLLKEDLEPKQLMQRLLAAVKKATRNVGRTKGATVEEIKLSREAFGDSSLLQTDRMRSPSPENSLGWLIAEYDRSDKDLSEEQRQLSDLDVSGFPRVVRGVAGSGKSIVLANQAGRFLAASAQSDLFEAPQRKIAIVCFNQAFTAHLKNKVARSYRSRTLHALPESTFIGHLNGLFYKISKQIAEFRYISLKSGSSSEDRALQYLTQIKTILESKTQAAEDLLFDAIFIDEGQDLHPYEIEALHLLVKVNPETNERPLIIFYDDSQNVYARPRPIWKQLGIDVSRGNRARVMKECFRNTREIVTFAFNILLGSQAANPALVSMREFAGLAELRQSNLVEESDGLFQVKFAEREGERPKFEIFNSREEEMNHLRFQLDQLLTKEHVDATDILILTLKKELCHKIAAALEDLKDTGKVEGFVLPASRENGDKDKNIFMERHITVSTVKSAKGYEAHIVFLAGVEVFPSSSEGRAEFYVGATRAKLSLTVTGVRSSEVLSESGILLPELERLQERFESDALKATKQT